MKGKIIKRRRYYEHAYFTDNRTGEITLLIRDYEARLMPSGRIRIHRHRDSLAFATETEMVAAVRGEQMRGIPEEAFNDRDYTPREFDKQRLQRRVRLMRFGLVGQA